MEAFSNFEEIVDIPVSKQQSTYNGKTDRRVLVDVKKEWEAAKKDEKERIATFIAVNEMVLHDLDPAINRARNDLVQLMEQYDCLSLTGSFVAQIERAAWSLERESATIEEKRIWDPNLKKVKEDLDHMKKMLELLRHIQETHKNALERCT